MKIDRAVIPPGLIRRSRTYSLIADDAGLWIICTGPAGREVAVDNALERFAVSKVYERCEKQILEGEERLATAPLADLAKEKHNHFFGYAEILGVVVDDTFGGLARLSVRTAKEKFAFQFHRSRKDEIGAIAECVLKAKAGA
jgi:hypothetical protein